MATVWEVEQVEAVTTMVSEGFRQQPLILSVQCIQVSVLLANHLVLVSARATDRPVVVAPCDGVDAVVPVVHLTVVGAAAAVVVPVEEEEWEVGMVAFEGPIENVRDRHI